MTMVSSLPAEYLDPATPPEVVVTDQIRPRVTDSTLGVPLGPAGPGLPSVPATPRHPLVTVGDSLTHGMSSGAVFHTGLSWPALVARSLGAGLVVPSYGGPLDGLPLNLEKFLRGLQDKFGVKIEGLEWVGLVPEAYSLANANENYWERGDGSRPPRTDLRYENVGIYGWDVRDCLSSTTARARANIASHPPHDDLIGAKPDNDNDIAAASVLAPFGPAAAQIDAVASHGHDGGIGTLVVMLGANNALGSVVGKKVVWSGPQYQDLDRKGAYTVWNPVHFQAEYAELVRRLLPVPARRVLLAPVPHVTVAPIATGVNPASPGRKWREGSRYFPYYTDPWIAESEFRPDEHRHITHQQARAIDSAIDQYNDTIQDHVRRARADGRDWYLVDLCGILDGVAYRRFLADPATRTANQAWQPYPLPAPIADLDTRFFRSDKTGRLQGGLFGLDAVHPTTVGYGIIAQSVLDVLGAAGITSPGIDFTRLLAQDTLNTNPPALFTQVLNLIGRFLVLLVSRP
jgi:hypothetical protein